MEIRNDTPFPSVEYNKGSGLPTIVFFGGFPDNETSGWGSVFPAVFKQTHHVVFICLPGYNKGGKLRPWAYNREELLDLLHVTLQQVVPNNEKFDLVTHDWGAHYGLSYQNIHPENIKTLTLIDVGMFNPKTLPLYTFIVISSYQSWFAMSYLLSQTLGHLVALVFMGIFFLPIFDVLKPTVENIYVPIKSITPEKCYPYYYVIKSLLTGTVKLPKFPTCPTLYMVS